MENQYSLLYLSLLLSFSLLHEHIAYAAGTNDRSEHWGYVEVRPKAHMFWWLYRSPFRVEDPSKPWPTILWLQGGPGGSGVGFGNFIEIGPLDAKLNPRNSTWLRKADLLFVDNPVATGFSFVEDKTLVVKTDEEAAEDLTTLLKKLFNRNETLQKSPLYIFAESYGGKFAVTLGVSALKAIEAGTLKLQLGGVTLGDSWISPEEFVFSWGPLLKDLSRIDSNTLKRSNSLAHKIRRQIAKGNYKNATASYNLLENFIQSNSNNVDFYNFLLDAKNDPVTGNRGLTGKEVMGKYSEYLSTKKYSPSNENHLPRLMNGPIRKKLKIIPKNVTWVLQSKLVFQAMKRDFMRPRIKEVDHLLAKGVNVTIYNGQVDLLCSTKGVEAWLKKLKWGGLKKFMSLDRIPLYCSGDNTTTKGFSRSYKNLYFYWILGAGHFVPVDQPCVSLEMVGNITRSPN